MSEPEAPAAPGDPPELEPDPVPRTSRARGRSVQRRRLVALVVVLGVLALPFLLAAGWFWWQLDPPGAAGDSVTVDVEQGWGVRQIADDLAARGVVGSSFAFQLYARATSAGPFQAGRFTLRKGMGARPAIAALERTPEIEYREVALPPGLTLTEIAARVGAVPGLDAAQFLAAAQSGVVRSRFQPEGVSSLEGLTWPDTYYVAESEDEEDLLRAMVSTFDERASALGLAEGGPGLTPYETVIVASLIQSEAKLDEERPLIAAVIRNRLDDETRLQIDATVIYARGTREGALTDADFARESPYNTYQVEGLPPTPISSVARASLEAALNPADVPYLFYVLIDENGRHRFAETFAEHEANIAEARRKGVL